MRFSGYIFDVEGTLMDSVQQNLLSLQVCLADFGISIPYELLQLYSGLDGDQTLQLVAPDLNAPERQVVLEAQGRMEAKYLRMTFCLTPSPTTSGMPRKNAEKRQAATHFF